MDQLAPSSISGNNINASLSRRERERVRHRRIILKAALDLFSTKGYHAVSMQEIAVRAEFAVGTLYKLFKNKEDLYHALLKDVSDDFHDAIKKVLSADSPPDEKIRTYIKIACRLFMSHEKAVRLYYAENFGSRFSLKDSFNREIRSSYEKSIYRLARVFAQGIQAGMYREINPHYLAISLQGILNTFLFHWLDAPEKLSIDSIESLVEDIFFNGILEQAS